MEVVVTFESQQQPLRQSSHTLMQGILKVALRQACQTQTTLRAAKATKTTEGAAKVLKLSYSGHILQYLLVKNDFTLFLVP